MVADAAFFLDQVRHPPRRPQTGFVTQSFRPALQPALDLLQIFRTQPRFASGPPRFPQTGQPGCLQLLGPAADRLPMGPDLPCHFGLMHSLLQQPRRPQAPLLQRLKVPSYSRRIPHGPTVAQTVRNVTIFFNAQ